MDVADLAKLVGVELFERACATAWATAEGTGRGWGKSWPHDLVNVPHDLSDVVEGDVELAFALYRVMPCYTHLMYVGGWGVGPDFWAHLRALLDDADPRLADPALYWLWCGPFESADEEEAATAWREMTTGAGDLRLRRVLECSGPVPWELKAPVLARLAAQSDWHPTVRSAIEAAATEYFGDIEQPAARRMLRRIGLRDTEVGELLGPQAGIDTARTTTRRRKSRQRKPHRRHRQRG